MSSGIPCSERLDRRSITRWLVFLAVVLVASPAGLRAQGSKPLILRGPDGLVDSLSVDRSRGYAAISGGALESLGWQLTTGADGVRASEGASGSVVEFAFDMPLFRWNGEVLQLVDVPYRGGDGVHIPAQFLVDFLPVRLSETYAFVPEEGVLQVRDSLVWVRLRPDAVERVTAPVDPGVASPSGNVEPEPSDSSVEDSASEGPARRVVIIDPGHGGRDPGTSGAGGRREKDIALAVGRALARELAGDETLEVFVTRDRDVLVPIWERGELATDWKGDRPGVFVSIHTNAIPNRSSVRGFETLFLSDARTEHERRVAANENAPLQIDREDAGVQVGDEEDLGFILRELRNLDHAHWSSLLAEGVQKQLALIHPGPNRGVKQAPLAVLTNALMPAVLVELGFVTNREEERLLSRGEFQARVAEALALAIRDFFERYPPGPSETVTGQRP